MGTVTNNIGQIGVGQPVTVQATFLVNNTPTDPTTVSFSSQGVYTNGGIAVAKTTVTYAGGGVTRAGVGVYQAIVTPTVDGQWQWRFVGTGACVAALDGAFTVQASPLA